MSPSEQSPYSKAEALHSPIWGVRPSLWWLDINLIPKEKKKTKSFIHSTTLILLRHAINMNNFFLKQISSYKNWGVKPLKMQVTIGNRDAKQKHEKHQGTNSPSPAEHAKQHRTNTAIKQLPQRHNSNKTAPITKAPFCFGATLFWLALASWTCWVSEHPYSRNTKAILLFWQPSPQN